MPKVPATDDDDETENENENVLIVLGYYAADPVRMMMAAVMRGDKGYQIW